MCTLASFSQALGLYASSFLLVEAGHAGVWLHAFPAVTGTFYTIAFCVVYD